MLIDDDVFHPKGWRGREKLKPERTGAARVECISKLFVFSCGASFGDHQKKKKLNSKCYRKKKREAEAVV